MTEGASKLEASHSGGLQRSVGFYGLMFVSLGSIIGSGWLLSALNASKTAGPAAIVSWVFAALCLAVLALVFAELGATYPVAGGTGRFPYFSNGPITGFVAGWSSWLQAVAIAPIEILAAITYVNSVKWVNHHFPMTYPNGDKAGLLNGHGLVVAVIGMILFTAMNLAGAKFMAESNSIVVIWKTLVPLLAIVVVASSSFHLGNFTAGGGFAPHGVHGIFAALPSAGVVFALQGFEQAVQLAGEARNPRKDISRAIITAMTIGGILYALLQAAFIAGVKPANVATSWDHALGGDASDYGAWYTLALAVGAGWLATILIIDAIVSPAGTGIVYVGTSARLSYALGEEPEMPSKLATCDKRGVPVWSILVAAVVGIACFGPFPSWNKLVGVVTGATAIMYAFAPIALGALKLRDPDRARSYRMPAPKILLPFAFCFADLLLYWGGYPVMWKLDCAMIFGLILFAIGRAVKKTPGTRSALGPALWIGPWLAGMTLIGAFGQYAIDTDGKGTYGPGKNSFIGKKSEFLGGWWDLILVIAFSLVIYYWAVRTAQTTEQVKAMIAEDTAQLEHERELSLPG